MIDNFVLALCHGLLLLAAWRLLSRPDLDDSDAPAPSAPTQGHGGWKASAAEAEERPGA